MNCRRIEKLLSLYVEGDLPSGLTNRVSSHLDWCSRCNWLADEYKESQNWLRASEPPEFDGAFLEDLKAGVLMRIKQDGTKPSALASLMQLWTRRQVFALAAAMLIIMGVVVFYIYQTRMSTQPSTVEAKRETPDNESPPQAKPAGETPALPGTAPGAGSIGPRRANNRLPRKARIVSPVIANRVVEPAPPIQKTPLLEDSTTGPVGPARVAPSIGFEQPPMLRIQIQTSDPNIRIIWFAPKETEIPKTTD